VITSASLGRVARHLAWVVESVEAILVLVAMTVTGSRSETETVMEDGLGMRAILHPHFFEKSDPERSLPQISAFSTFPIFWLVSRAETFAPNAL
jgi:hypothetical protein